MKKIKKARIGTTSSSTTRKPVGMTMKELKMKYPTIDTNARGDVRGTEMNAYAPLRELQKYNDAYNAFERKFGNKPATDNTAMKKPVKKPIKKSKNGTSLGMKSVKAGFDKNPGVTRADIIVAAKKKAKMGMKVKAQNGKMIEQNVAKMRNTSPSMKKPMTAPPTKKMIKSKRVNVGGGYSLGMGKMGTKVSKTKKCKYGCK